MRNNSLRSALAAFGCAIAFAWVASAWGFSAAAQNSAAGTVTEGKCPPASSKTNTPSTTQNPRYSPDAERQRKWRSQQKTPSQVESPVDRDSHAKLLSKLYGPGQSAKPGSALSISNTPSGTEITVIPANNGKQRVVCIQR